ncbi:LysR family transcriptional regulator [Aureimonas glaciei]|uniref:LysR family transcriptional regulator n=1 Tax=Aureimonas glaciei TaxID=1776957 RepID=A0A916YAP3_9HYPH|nr:LysR family transcriptional regulator [Aureimonas glaciei]GGD38085.1 LysR family transcriptional regulator [Aureimonas glaciei]
MDTELARTFLEIVSTRSFIRAAERLHISQTAVSARVRTLEDRLGRSLFVRNKSGATLTPAGEQFLRYAPGFVQLWERARHQVAVPPGRRALLSVGGELSLWHPLLIDWLLWMKRCAPDIALRMSVDLAADLARQVADGLLDLAIMYAPQQRPGLKVELLLEEKLVLVRCGGENGSSDFSDYVYVDWGSDFTAQHNLSFPDLANPGLFVGLGPLGLDYILAAGGSGYFRLSAVRPHLAAKRLHLVPKAPEFSHHTYAVYSATTDEALIQSALEGMRAVAGQREA